MKLIKYSLLALAMAFTFSSCDDDNKYVEGVQSPGAFFPKNSPEVVELPQTGNTVDITIGRTSLDDPSTYTIVCEEESGIFSFPSTVTFGPQEHTTSITVTFDETAIITDELYPATIRIEGASVYGDNTYSFDFCRKSPVDITETEGLYYTDFLTGGPFDINIDWCVSQGDPSQITVVCGLWGNGEQILIDLSKTFPDGTHPAKVAQIYPTGLLSDDGYEYMWSSVYDFYTMLGYSDAQIEEMYPNIEQLSNFNADTGVISLFNCCWRETDKAGSFSWTGEMEEIIRLAGYPDYSVEVEYTGLFVAPNGSISSNIAVNSGTDVKEVRVANVATNNYSDALEGLKAGSYEFQTVEGGKEATLQFPIEDAGTYTVVAVSVDADGKMQLDAYQTYKVTIGVDDPNKGWTSLGTGLFTDAINVAGLIWQGEYSPADWTYDVEIQEKDDEPGVYRVADIYANHPYNRYNVYDEPGYFIVNCSNPGFIEAPLQFVGYEDEYGKLSYGNYEAYLKEQNPDVSEEEILAFMKSKNLGISTIKDGVITIPGPIFTFSIQSPNPRVGPYPFVIQLPSAVAASPRKVAGSKTYTGSKKDFVCKKAINQRLERVFVR